MKYSYDELLEMVVKDIPIKRTSNVCGITFIGLPGVGKTTVANKLSKITGFYVASNDKIRCLLEKLGYDVEGKHRKIVESLANDRTKYMLKNRVSMIIDANMNGFYEMAINNFKEYNANIYFIKLECPEEEILNRIEKRLISCDSNNYSKANKDDYFRNKEKYEFKSFPVELVFATINTSDDIDSQIDIIINKLLKTIN